MIATPYRSGTTWNHHANYAPGFLDKINANPGRVGYPLPDCPQDIHEFWRGWNTRGWFEWESEGYPCWGNLPNILFVHYNDLLADTAGEIRLIAAFLNIPLDEEMLPAIVQAVAFDAMREGEIGAERPQPSVFVEGAKTFFFKGANGRWKEVLSDEELALYGQKAAQMLTPDCRVWLEQGGTHPKIRL